MSTAYLKPHESQPPASRSAAEIRGDLNHNVKQFCEDGSMTVGMMNMLHYGASMEIAAQLAELRERLEKILGLPTGKV